jgi:hypothetical protein
MSDSDLHGDHPIFVIHAVTRFSFVGLRFLMLRLEMALTMEFSASRPPQQLSNFLISVKIGDVEKMVIFWSFPLITWKIMPSPLSGMHLRGGYCTESSDLKFTNFFQ